MEETSNTRRSFLRRAGIVTGSAAALTFGGLTGLAKAGAAAGPSGDSTGDIINAALTAEQLAVTFYYSGLLAAQIGQLAPVADPDDLNYFQAALWEEHTHAGFLAELGAVSLAGTHPKFYYPNGSFTHASVFFRTLDTLETAFIAAYTAAVGEWAGDSSAAVATTGSFTGPQLAKIAAQILGVECEHRCLGRVANNQNPPNNLILERALFTQVGSPTNLDGTAVGALLPFVTGGAGLEGPFKLPNSTDVRAMASPYDHLTDPGFAAP